MAKKEILRGKDLLDGWATAKSQGLSVAEYAEKLGISHKSLDNRLYRAKRDQPGYFPKITAEETNDVKISDVINGNYRMVTVQGCQIQTINQLIKACEIDLSVWDIPESEVRSWPLSRRAEAKSVRYKNGKIIDGYIEDSGKLFSGMQFYIKLKLVRKKLLPVSPHIEIIRYKLSKRKHSKENQLSTGKALLVSDSQTGFRRNFDTGELTPFHDRSAHDVVLNVAERDNFDAVVILGDGLDFTEWTDKFLREPEFYFTTQPAVIEYAWFLSQLRSKLPNADFFMVAGNHEKRKSDYLMTHLRASYGLKPATELHLEDPYSVPRLLGLENLNIDYVSDYPNGEVWLSEYLKIMHNTKLSGAPGATATNMLKDTTVSVVVGHNHRLEQASKTIDDRGGLRFVTAATCGCLCHLDYRVPGHRRGQNWQTGFGVAYYNTRSPKVELIPIVDSCAIYHGNVIKGHDYIEQLKEDTKYKF